VSADLYHIEFERSENISNLPQGKYIEPSGTMAYRQNAKKDERFARSSFFADDLMEGGKPPRDCKTISSPLSCIYSTFLARGVSVAPANSRQQKCALSARRLSIRDFGVLF